MNGKYIVLEGIDGCGKTTQFQLLQEWSSVKKRNNILFRREPSDSTIGQLIRQFLKEGDIDQNLLSLLFAADRRIENQVIDSFLPKGINIIYDRSKYSSLVYQREVTYVGEINAHMREPDLVILIDMAPEEILHRRIGTNTDEMDTFEKDIVFQRECREEYLRIASKRDNFIVVDGNQNPRVLNLELSDIIEKELNGGYLAKH